MKQSLILFKFFLLAAKISKLILSFRKILLHEKKTDMIKKL